MERLVLLLLFEGKEIEQKVKEEEEEEVEFVVATRSELHEVHIIRKELL